MRLRNLRSFPFAFLLLLSAHLCVAADYDPESVYEFKRQRAVDLFAQNRRLEALPLLEELVQTNPKDDAMLVALAASLVDHAATLADPEAAGRERLRARSLVDRALDLGNTSPLTMNLSQLLRQLPASGAIEFSADPEVEKAMRAGEAAFARRDFAEARKNYANALELESGNYTAALFMGNAYHKQGRFAEGAEWYERAIHINPDVETAYRYYADMLAAADNMSGARSMLIRAAVAEPYNRMVWRELRAWATLNHTQINQIYIGVPPPLANRPSAKQQPTPVAVDVWQVYRQVRASWQTGQKFRKHFPEEQEYRHSLWEESEALTAAAEAAEKLDAEAKEAPLVSTDQSVTLLLKLHQQSLIEPYVLFSLGDAGIARDYDAYRVKHRDKLEEYLDTLVVPQVP
jgi:tetratricopeptide (TPR) repeat protein